MRSTNQSSVRKLSTVPKNSNSFVVLLFCGLLDSVFRVLQNCQKEQEIDVLIVYIGSHQIAVLEDVVKKLCCVIFLTKNLFIYK